MYITCIQQDCPKTVTQLSKTKLSKTQTRTSCQTCIRYAPGMFFYVLSNKLFQNSGDGGTIYYGKIQDECRSNARPLGMIPVY